MSNDQDKLTIELLAQMQGVMGGLIERMDVPPIVSLDSGYAKTGRALGSCDNAIVPTHCMRTVSQRSLSAPVTFLGAPAHVGAATDVFAAAVTSAVSGCLPGVGTGGTAPIRFHDADVADERQRIDELVLIGARAKLAVQAQAGAGGAIVPFNQGLFVEALKDFMRDYIVFRIYNTSDQSEEWVDSTPLRYIDRRDGEFVAMPPVLWKNRDPHMEMDVRTADHGAAANQLPTVELGSTDIDIQAGILFESLWIPNPDYCGSFWPGSMCPSDRVKGWKGYIGK